MESLVRGETVILRPQPKNLPLSTKQILRPQPKDDNPKAYQ